MTCRRCGTANEATRKFCRECGEQLGNRCVNCGALESGDSKFCGQCGRVLPAGQAAAPRIAPRSSGEEAEPGTERRLVSVMFADLVSFTSLAEGRDPEQVRELLGEYYDLAREVVGRYRGVIEKFVGDAVMAVWGAPVAREDDAERAVRCALDLVDSVAILAGRLGLPELTIRAGVHTGEAAVSIGAIGQGLVAGEVVNTAARLQAAAGPATVVVGESTQRAASRSIAFRRLRDQPLKGMSAPVALWQATHLVALASGEGQAPGGLLQAPFVGRAEEMRLLRELYHSTVREGRARLVSIVGQAGIGKTRLVWELEKYVTGLADESRWFQGRSPAYEEGISYWALGEVVRRAASIAEGDSAADTRQKLSALLEREVADEAERSWLEPRLGALLGTDPIPEDDRGELFSAWRAFFESIARRSAIVLVFEDVHWADGGLLDFIESVPQWSRGFPILIVSLARPELLERRPTWGAKLRSFTSVHLDPLSQREMRELLDGLAPGLPSTIAEQVVQRAEGVPLYAVETVRMLIDQAVLEVNEDGYRLLRAPERLTLPETLHALIASRLDSLTPSERRLLQTAAVLGQTFEREALLAVSNGTAGPAIDDLVAELVGKELLQVERDPRSPERGQLAFVQSAIREVAYATLARSERRSRHVAAARYFSEPADEEAVGVAASHYLAAYQAAPEDSEAAELRSRARSFLLAAADRARALHSYEQTLAYLRQALAITDDPAEKAPLWERAGDVARSVEDADTAEEYLSHAIAWYGSRGDRAAVARATATLSTALIDGVRTQQAIELIRRTLDELGLDDEPAAVPLMANLGRALFIRAEWRESLEWSDRALVAGERYDDIAAVIEALINRAGAVEGLGRSRESEALLRGAIVLAERHGASVSALRAANNLGALVTEDAPREAEAFYQSALQRAESSGEFGYVSNFRHALLEVRFGLGQWSAVVEQVARMEDEELARHEWEHLNDLLAVIAAYRAEDARAQELLARWKEDPRKTVSQHEAAHHHALAQVALAGGRPDRAYLEATTAAESTVFLHDGQFVAGRAAVWLKDSAKLALALEKFDEKGAHTQLRKAQRATLSAALGLLHEPNASSAYDDALARWAELDNPLQLGMAHLEHTVLAPAGPSAARSEAEARRLFNSLGAELSMERLRNSLATQD